MLKFNFIKTKITLMLISYFKILVNYNNKIKNTNNNKNYYKINYIHLNYVGHNKIIRLKKN